MRLFAWGANTYGQLGIGKCSECESSPVEVEINMKISAIGCGGNHTIIIDENGDLWSCGRNNRSQLGDRSTKDQNLLTKILTNDHFKSVSAGWDMSCAISTDNRLYVWGSNKYGQLGYPTSHEIISEPTEIKLPFQETPLSVQFGLRFMAILTHTNKLFIVGSLNSFKDNNRLEVVDHNSCEYLKVIDDKISMFSAGQKHIIMVSTKMNTVTGIGDNKFKQISEINLDENVKLLRSGWTHNAIISEKSKNLYLWGRNNYGQLGNGKKTDFSSTPQKCEIHPVEQIALGAEHGIMMSNSSIYTWGWNEHGNCGNGNYEDL